jgi:hypothetical protein
LKDGSSKTTMPNRSSTRVSTRSSSICMDVEEMIPFDNESLLRIRIDRIKRKILETELRTKEDICYLEQDAKLQQATLLKKMREMKPYDGITFLHKATVNDLHEEAKALRKQMKCREGGISAQVSIAVKLTKESHEIQSRTKEMLASMGNAHREHAKHTNTLERLNLMHQLIGTELLDQHRVPIL